MCGICFWLQFSHATEFKPYYEKALQLIARRGSDYQGFHDIRVNGTSKTMNFHGCVLHLRGEKLGCQPAIDANGNVLLWNGEIFGGLEV
ncbi:Asparagine synthetase domain-containing protein 1 [Trichoplax sp. H2]|nr:Asparagine synthetase domain-containing protein 1 [Trichoplax sp. H2]|eukprot:RDD46244.1 Asparagine synthetase domain-containing protein 1 [Trichoplax sp. H2]